MTLRTVAFAILCAFWFSGTAMGQIVRLPHADSTAGNFFGVSVAIDGNRALVGASSEDACGPNSGAAYVFERADTADVWQRVARLTHSDCETGDFFGRTLDLSGNRAVVAAAETFFNAAASNAAYVFERDSTTGAWRQTARLTADGDVSEGAFATSVSLDHDRVLVTTSGDPSNGQYGGAAYVFDYDPASRTWSRSVRLTGSGGVRDGIFGGSGTLDGDRIAVAASTYFREKPGSIYIFELAADGRWRESHRISGIFDFFISLDLQDDLLLVGESKAARRGSGVATLYERTGDGWKRLQRLQASTPYDHGAFGTAVSLSSGLALVVGYDEQLGHSFNIDRVVYVFRPEGAGGEWVQRSVLDIGQVAFGASVDHDGRHAIIGSASDDVAGAAYVARLPNVD